MNSASTTQARMIRVICSLVGFYKPYASLFFYLRNVSYKQTILTCNCRRKFSIRADADCSLVSEFAKLCFGCAAAGLLPDRDIGAAVCRQHRCAPYTFLCEQLSRRKTPAFV